MNILNVVKFYAISMCEEIVTHSYIDLAKIA